MGAWKEQFTVYSSLNLKSYPNPAVLSGKLCQKIIISTAIQTQSVKEKPSSADGATQQLELPLVFSVFKKKNFIYFLTLVNI